MTRATAPLLFVIRALTTSRRKRVGIISFSSNEDTVDNGHKDEESVLTDSEKDEEKIDIEKEQNGKESFGKWETKNF